MKNTKALVWLRDDFRIKRNNALIFAAENHDQVSSVFIFNLEEFEKKEKRKDGGFIIL